MEIHQYLSTREWAMQTMDLLCWTPLSRFVREFRQKKIAQAGFNMAISDLMTEIVQQYPQLNQGFNTEEI